MQKRRSEGPPRCYDDYRPGAEHATVTVSGPGWHHIFVASIPPNDGRRRPRSDQYVVTEDGALLPKVRTLTALFDLARNRIPRRLTRDELATL